MKQINITGKANRHINTVFSVYDINGITPLNSTEKLIFSNLSKRSDFYDGFRFKSVEINGVVHNFYLNDYLGEDLVDISKILDGSISPKSLKLTTAGFVLNTDF